MFLPQTFFLSKQDLRAPSADRRKVLPHDRNLLELYNAGPKIFDIAHLKKNLGPKTCKIWRDFGHLQTLTTNISEMDEDIKSQKTIFTAIFPVNFETLTKNFGL